MKSPDDHLNNELRNALRSRFDDFELKPEAGLKKNIFTHLRAWQREQAFQRTLIASLLFAILLTGTLFYSSKQESVGKEIAGRVKSVRGGKVNVVKSKIPDRIVESEALVKTESSRHEKTSLAAEDLIISNTTGAEIPATEFPAENIESESQIEKAEISGISYLDNLPAHFEHSALTISDSIAYFEKSSEKQTKTDSKWTLLTGVTPVKSFQILSILPNSGQLYRNFEFPGSASFETLGYKLNAGVEKRGLQFLLSYGHYRQSVRYEVAGNEFEVVPNGSSAEARRKYTAVSSERTLNLVGLGIRKQLVPRAPALRAFYGVAGVELTREFTEGENMVWANAGIGRQVRVGRNTALHIGPYFEYGFKKLVNAEGTFQVKPYQVGLSVMLRNNFVK